MNIKIKNKTITICLQTAYGKKPFKESPIIFFYYKEKLLMKINTRPIQGHTNKDLGDF